MEVTMGKPCACKRCGVENLVWKQVEGKWKLFTESSVLHTCLGPIKNYAKSSGKSWSKPAAPSIPPEFQKAIEDLTGAINGLRNAIESSSPKDPSASAVRGDNVFLGTMRKTEDPIAKPKKKKAEPQIDFFTGNE